MPELDRLEATSRIRARFGFGAAPTIIAMMANAMHGEREECLGAGMDDDLPKPIRVDEVAGALARCRPISEAGDDPSMHSEGAVGVAALENLASSLGGGDEGWDGVEDLIAAFLEDAPTEIATLRDAVERGDAAETRRVAHNLKSNGATFGAQAFSGVCRELEAHGRQDELDGASALLERAAEKWQDARQALEAFRAGRKAR
jgi:HPt (histidine-containing phosphotransfer) domain-containing protein